MLPKEILENVVANQHAPVAPAATHLGEDLVLLHKFRQRTGTNPGCATT
jgi:hypothetical protein